MLKIPLFGYVWHHNKHYFCTVKTIEIRPTALGSTLTTNFTQQHSYNQLGGSHEQRTNLHKVQFSSFGNISMICALPTLLSEKFNF